MGINYSERIGEFVDIRILRYFLTIAREESISGAADFLHLTQPTLSRQIKELEDELGTTLLIRGNRNISLTESGMLLRKRAEEIINLVDKAAAELMEPEEAISGDIHIGSGETEAIRAIAKIAKKLQEDYPMIRYHLFSGNADDVKERLDNGLLDFGILIEPSDIKKYDFLRLPSIDQWGLLMRKDSELASKDAISPKDLWDIPLLCSAQSMVRNVLTGWIGKNMDDLNIVATYNLIYNATIMVEEGFGYALCLDKLVNTTGNSNLCFIPLSPTLEAHLDIVWKKYQVFSKAAKTFLDHIQAEI
jgi:DNA-binding transcriptional LysR family regulator